MFFLYNTIFETEWDFVMGNHPEQFPARDCFALQRSVTYCGGKAENESKRTPVFWWGEVFPLCRRGLDRALLMTGEEAVLICKPVSSI